MNGQAFGPSTFRVFAASQLGEEARTAPLPEVLESLEELAREEGWGEAISKIRGGVERPSENRSEGQAT